ncbi:MAG: hypothetical protein IPN79_20015 [Saprospiraceae bacterium]|nr:hypothetical protein [Saprospiraceae bacterium]
MKKFWNNGNRKTFSLSGTHHFDALLWITSRQQNCSLPEIIDMDVEHYQWIFFIRESVEARGIVEGII